MSDITENPDPILARLERMFFPDGLTLEDRVRMGVRAAKMEMTPSYIAMLRHLRPGVRLQRAFELWRMARGALYAQGLRRGLSPDAAMHDAARRMLTTKNDV